MGRIRAGELREQVIFERATKVSDGQGGYRKEWSTFIVTRAAIWPLSAKQVVQHNQLENKVTHRVRIRYQKDITSDLRINHEGRIFYFEGPPLNIDEKNRVIDLLCREEV